MLATKRSNKKDIHVNFYVYRGREGGRGIVCDFLYIGFFLLVKMITNWIYANATRLEIIYKLEIIT